MSISTFQVDVVQTVLVSLDTEKLDEQFMEEFRASFYPFSSLVEHAEHIAQLAARGIIDIEHVGEFIEGYGPSTDMGIGAKVVTTYVARMPA